MYEPARVKFRKQHRRRGAFQGRATRGGQLSFGSYGLKTVVAGELTARQLEAARRAMTHAVARGGKIWVRVFPHNPVTRKAAEVPMGAGKGSLEYWGAILKAGTMIFEMDGLPEETAREALRLAGHKLPLKTRFVTRITH